jgi:Protein of unknown function (DUF3365).
MINPAYMTRQIAEIAAAGDGVRLHITSLNPIRPENRPDPWEAEALARFDRGDKEVLALILRARAGAPLHGAAVRDPALPAVPCRTGLQAR